MYLLFEYEQGVVSGLTLFIKILVKAPVAVWHDND